MAEGGPLAVVDRARNYNVEAAHYRAMALALFPELYDEEAEKAAAEERKQQQSREPALPTGGDA